MISGIQYSFGSWMFGTLFVQTQKWRFWDRTILAHMNCFQFHRIPSILHAKQPVFCLQIVLQTRSWTVRWVRMSGTIQQELIFEMKPENEICTFRVGQGLAVRIASRSITATFGGDTIERGQFNSMNSSMAWQREFWRNEARTRFIYMLLRSSSNSSSLIPPTSTTESFEPAKNLL